MQTVKCKLKIIKNYFFNDVIRKWAETKVHKTFVTKVKCFIMISAEKKLRGFSLFQSIFKVRLLNAV